MRYAVLRRISSYDYLAQAGVRIYEHFERHMHCKVAVVDGEWSTVGSSNLDPASLFLNLEANLVIKDRGFAEDLRGRLMNLASKACVELDPENLRHHSPAAQLLNVAAFEFMRQMPSIARMLPLGIGKTSDHAGSGMGSREES